MINTPPAGFRPLCTHDVCQLVLVPCNACVPRPHWVTGLNDAPRCTGTGFLFLSFFCFFSPISHHAACQFGKRCAPAPQRRASASSEISQCLYPLSPHLTFQRVSSFSNWQLTCVYLLLSARSHASQASVFAASNLMLWIFSNFHRRTRLPHPLCVSVWARNTSAMISFSPLPHCLSISFFLIV